MRVTRFFDNSIPLCQQLRAAEHEFSALADHAKDLFAYSDEMPRELCAPTALYYVLPLLRMLTQQVCQAIIDLTEEYNVVARRATTRKKASRR